MLHKIKLWHQKKKVRRMLRVACKLLRDADDIMKKSGMTRQERRAFWRELVSKNDKLAYIEEPFKKVIGQ